MRKLLIFIILLQSFSVSHAIERESNILSKDVNQTNSLNSQVNKEVLWSNTSLKNDDKTISFKAIYKDDWSGISVVYEIPYNTEQQVYFDNPNNCKVENVKVEFVNKKFIEKGVDIKSGKIWIDNSHYFEVYKDILPADNDNFFININPKDLQEILMGEANLRFTFKKSQDLSIPFLSAKTQVKNAQDACLNFIKDERNKRIAKAQQAQALERKKREAESEKIRKQNEKYKQLYLEQMKKPDVKIGMTPAQVIKNTRWGAPIKINSTITKYVTREQWVYPDFKFLYFDNGKLVVIQK